MTAQARTTSDEAVNQAVNKKFRVLVIGFVVIALAAPLTRLPWRADTVVKGLSTYLEGVLVAVAFLSVVGLVMMIVPRTRREFGLPNYRNSDEREQKLIYRAMGNGYVALMVAVLLYAWLFHTPEIVTLVVVANVCFVVSIVVDNRKK